ncbi:hypothetical protein CLM62_23190, partial [Streptomyces sp. SA15]
SWGRPGWRALAPSCGGCLRGRTSVSLAGFARLAGEGLRVVAGKGAALPMADLAEADGLGVPELVAEAALLQARLDWFQAQLARLGEHGPGGAPQG